MSINFRKLEESDEVKQILMEHLQIGISTVTDVQTFLEAQDLECSELWEFSEHNVGQGFFRELMTEAFESFMRCAIRDVAWSKTHKKRFGRWPWQWLWKWVLDKTVTWNYFVHFSFRNQTLVQIVVWKTGTGF